MQVCRAKQQPVLRGDADDGSRMLGAELDPPSIGYFWLQTERDFDPALYDFFGKGHYVEVADQSYGRYGGLRRLSLENDGAAIIMQLDYELPAGGRDLKIECPAPLRGAERNWIEQLARDVGAERGDA